MELLIVRHAIAVEREEFAATGRPDGDRPLTDYGRRRMRKNARGIHRIAPRLDVVGASPYLRAADTARIVAETSGVERLETIDALTPDHHPRDLLPWLSQQDPGATVAVVGHEPHLGALVTWLVGGRDGVNAEFKKGGACLLRFDGRIDAGTAVLQWMLTPAQLRAIAD